MRMWNVPTKFLCNNHLLGEHLETHMFVGCINKGKSLQGYINNSLVEIDNIENRHNLLAKEMIKRGFNHKSPLPKYNNDLLGNVNVETNIKELIERCKECRKRIKRG